MKVLLSIPAYNEEGNIQRVLENLLVVFTLIVKLSRISKLERKLQSLAQAIAIREKGSEPDPAKAQEAVRK